jgi:hypothetical protein
MGWIEWGGELIWAVGFTSGGAPYGLRACELDPSEQRAIELDIPGVEDAESVGMESWIDEPDRLGH